MLKFQLSSSIVDQFYDPIHTDRTVIYERTVKKSLWNFLEDSGQKSTKVVFEAKISLFVKNSLKILFLQNAVIFLNFFQ